MEIEKSNVNIKITLGIKYIAMAVIIGIIVGIVDTILAEDYLPFQILGQLITNI